MLQALTKIENAVNEINDLFPGLCKEKIKIEPKKGDDPLRTLKRVNGIIINFNGDNAERKLDSLIKFLKPKINKK